MSNNPNKIKRKRDEVAQIIADKTEYSVGYVRMVRNGDRHNDEIENLLMEYVEGKSKLIEHIEKIVPLDGTKAKNNRKKPSPKNESNQ